MTCAVITCAQSAEPENPIPYTRAAIKAGRMLFVQNCVACHGDDGKAMVSVVGNAADLTAPERWKNGFSDARMFRTITEGTAMGMPAFESQLHPDQIWMLIDFIKSLWPDSPKPTDQE